MKITEGNPLKMVTMAAGEFRECNWRGELDHSAFYACI
jgi:hypothetical protein